MKRRRDAATAVAELAPFIEQRAARDGDSVSTIGMLQVPGGSINVVPGRCTFSLDLRAPHDAQRDTLKADVLACGMQSIITLIVRRQYGPGPTMALKAHGGVVPPVEGWIHDR